MSPINQLFSYNGEYVSTLCLRILPEELSEAKKILHAAGFKWASGRCLLDSHVDNYYARYERRGECPHLEVQHTGKVYIALGHIARAHKPTTIDQGLLYLYDVYNIQHEATSVMLDESALF